ncbi:tudor domain-containing protein 7A [Osmerus eperlanus]|uniref:tudor domain-containing protein 7A n=1 Tax=Osmerus eperlanus TaxID=29151 RepID=UPI002E0FDE66
MSEDMTQKMLRAVLQSNKNGVSITRLQSDFKSLTGEFIQHRQRGYPSLEAYLRTMPSVARLENRMGEVMCFAGVCEETAHIAQLVARQKSSKKCGRSQMVNCRMRSNLSSQFMFSETRRILRLAPAPLLHPDKSRLRQPAQRGHPGWGMARQTRPRGYGGCSIGGDYRLNDNRFTSNTPLQHRAPSAHASTPAPASVQMKAATPYERRVIYAPRQHKVNGPVLTVNILNHAALPAPSTKPTPPSSSIPPSRQGPSLGCVYNLSQVQGRLKQLLAKYSSGLWLSKLPSVYRDMFCQDLPGQALIDMEKWTSVCLVEKPCSTNRADRLVYPPTPKPKPSTSTSSSTPFNPGFNFSKAAAAKITFIPTFNPRYTFTAKHGSPDLASPTPSRPIVAPSPARPAPPLHIKAVGSPPLAQPLSSPTTTPSSLRNTSLSTPSSLRNSSLSSSPTTTPSSLRNTSCSSPTTTPSSLRNTSCSSPTTTPSSLRNTSCSSPTTTPSSLRNTSCSSPTTTPSSLRNTSCSSPTTTPSSLRNTSCSSPTTTPSSLRNSSLSSPTTPSPLRTLSPLSSRPLPPALSVPADVRSKLKELLSKYPHGLWAHALSSLFLETYKTPFPEGVLNNLSVLLDICTVEFPMPNNKNKAILYGPRMQPTTKSPPPPSGLPVCPSLVPPLEPPRELFPSVLVMDTGDASAVTLRYVGESYSQALEDMEDAMKLFYRQASNQLPVPAPVTGQLATVWVEDEDEVVRVQVTEVMVEKDEVKVYYVDHGFSEVILRTQLMELQQDFLKLPLQATNCRLAGVEAFGVSPVVVRTLESLTLEKILLLEVLERPEQELPLVVLYNTSLDQDLNINACCLHALHDTSMSSTLQESTTFEDVLVTNVYTDGTVFCQVPSRGRRKLQELLEKIEAFFVTQVTSECLVSRPFSGKVCLARYQGNWSRAEITMLHGSKVMDILFIDLGVPASVEITELREIPPPLLHDLLVIPPQAIKCCLADVPTSVWTQEAVVWLKNAVLPSISCSMTISKVDSNRVVHMSLFNTPAPHSPSCSLNHQMALAGLWKPPSQGPARPSPPPTSDPHLDLSDLMGQLSLSTAVGSPLAQPMSPPQAQSEAGGTPTRSDPALEPLAGGVTLPLPPLMELPKAHESMDVFVPVACHPDYFVVQSWQDMFKLVVLMGEMILYYNNLEGDEVPVCVGEVYAAKVENNWHRVLVKGMLTNGLVSVYELDYGKHELVSCILLRTLIEEFRQLPFQAITAQLAGVDQHTWSEAASIVFRNHVEKRPLVAQVESVQEAPLPWDRKLTLYLVDTSRVDADVWVHNIMADFAEEFTTAA